MNEELATARGQIGVLRDLLMEALGVIEEQIDDPLSNLSLRDLKDQMRAAIEGTKP